MRKTSIILLLAVLLAGCLPAASTAVPVTVPAPETHWWDDTVFYEIFVRSFYDTNGDGIGDFNGITQNLAYLKELGVSGIWLMPIFPSPSYHGYDVTDYYNVNPQYGTMDEFKNLLKESHQQGIRIIIDLPLNHTSDRHPWFVSAESDVNSPYRNWYIWQVTDPNYPGPWGEVVWHSSPTGYYYGIFESHMPDLNYNNPAVTQEMDKIAAYWLIDVGVDGFRLDAAQHLIEEGTQQKGTVSTHKWYADFRPVYKAANPNAMTIAEIFGEPAKTLATYTSGDQVDLAFNFDMAVAFISSANMESASYAANALQINSKILPAAQYAPFLSNHDQNRTMSQLYGNIHSAKVAASLLLTSPGVPFIYYGEEIGMIGMKPDENIRRPMQWSAETNAGFSTGTPWRPPDSGYLQVNVAAQMNDPDSLLSHYRALIRVRNGHSALRTGNIKIIPTSHSSVYALLRTEKNEMVLVLINLGDQVVKNYSLDLQGISPNASLIPLLGQQETTLSISKQPVAELPPFSTYIFQIK